MASSTPHIILLKVNGDRPAVDEFEADVALTPGELVYINADNEAAPHASAGQDAAPLFVLENYASSTNSSASIDTDWAAGDRARIVHARPGDEVYAFIKAGGSVSLWGQLESDGAGNLQAHTAQPGTATTIYSRAVVARAMELKDNSAGTARARVRVRIV